MEQSLPKSKDTARQLNGWQRLWVVLSVAWALFVLVLAMLAVPDIAVTADETREFVETVSDATVRSQLTASENKVLSDPGEFYIAKFGGKLVNPYKEPDPDSLPLPRISSQEDSTPKTPEVLSVAEFAQRVKRRYPELAKTNDDVVVANVLARYPVYKSDVDPRSLEDAIKRHEDLIAAQVHVYAIVEPLAAMAARRQKQRRDSGVFALSALIPPVVLYVFGWSVAWIRRGFRDSMNT